ncbi:hypothetical protein [Halosegnis marinus]|uniref:hypothetical protein n=1 Tax=Halosegnis marinus TaxID=3034023 RepID=UPI0036102AD1
MRPGPVPRLVGDDGFEHVLDSRYGFEREVERVLKQTFLLDCLTRTEGIYDVPLHERAAVEDGLDLDFAALYDADPTDRLARYLDVPFDAVSAYVPQWKLTAHVTPDADSVETLPFLVDDLAVVRTPADREPTRNRSQLAAIEEFTRTRAAGGVATRSRAGRARDEETWSPPVIEPESADSIEQAWVGPGAPVGASKALPQAFRNRLDRGEKEGDVEIVVVCNDDEMLDEHETARGVYGSREELPFEVTFYEDLTTDRLAIVLESEVDYFHYIGHIEREGFRCSDGMLDVRELDAVAMDTFFLNACTSYEQGMALIEKGAVGGIVTLDEVINSGAIRVGKAMSRLLNRGFPLRAGLNIAAERSIVGNQYIVIGDGNMDIAHAESLIPNLLEVNQTDEDTYDVFYRSYYAGRLGVGTMTRPNFEGNDEHYLIGSPVADFTVDKQSLRDFLSLEVIPLQIGHDFAWSDEFSF